MKRAWKPLDIERAGICLRLYRVKIRFRDNPHWNDDAIVAAQSPSHAAKIYTALYGEVIWSEKPDITGYPLNIYQPESWTE